MKGELAPGDPAAKEDGRDVVCVAVIMLCTRCDLPAPKIPMPPSERGQIQPHTLREK